MSHGRVALDHAEDGNDAVMSVACSRWMMWIGEECVVKHDDRLMVFTSTAMLAVSASGLLADGAP